MVTHIPGTIPETLNSSKLGSLGIAVVGGAFQEDPRIGKGGPGDGFFDLWDFSICGSVAEDDWWLVKPFCCHPKGMKKLAFSKLTLGPWQLSGLED